MTPGTQSPVWRFDRVDAAEMQLKPAEEQDNGWLKVWGRISRVGIQEYVGHDGKVHKELRLPEDVFEPESMASFGMRPVTDDHPPVLLDANNTKEYGRDYSAEGVFKADDTWLAAALMITDAVTIRNVRTGKCQLSNGYLCLLVATTPELVAKWGEHEWVQKRIRGNHIAIVDEARAGPDARLRLDSTGAQTVARPTGDVTDSGASQRREDTSMTFQLSIGTLRLDMNDANGPAIQTAVNEAIATAVNDAKAKLTAETHRADGLEKKGRILRKNGETLLSRLDSIRKIMDAKKAMMASCDECGGTGKTVDDADETKQKTCDFCDGAGSYRMHSAIAAPTDSDMPDDDDVTEAAGEEMDADELETEQATEAEAGAANPKKDSAADRKRKAEGADFRKRLDASRERILNRAVRARVVLQDSARRVLGDEFDFAKLDAAGIERAVLAKVAPNAKIDGRSNVEVTARFRAEMERLDDSGAQEIDTVRRIVEPPPRTTTGRIDSGGARPRGRAAMLARNDELSQIAAGRKPVEHK